MYEFIWDYPFNECQKKPDNYYIRGCSLFCIGPMAGLIVLALAWLAGHKFCRGACASLPILTEWLCPLHKMFWPFKAVSFS